MDITEVGQMRSRIAQFCASTSRWLFLSALVVAPWFYGGTTDEAIGATNVLLTAVLIFWFFELLFRERSPKVPVALAACAGLLCLVGWCSAWNAVAVYDTDFELFAPLAPALELLPQSVDRIVSTDWMIRVTLLLASSCFAAELAQHRKWLLRLWYTVAIAGTSLALLGLAQKASGAEAAFWSSPGWDVKTFFGPFYYHGNAGAFINLVLPLIAGLGWRAARKGDAPVERALWLGASLVTISAVFVNTSRVAQLVGLLTITGLAIGGAGSIRRRLQFVSVRQAAIVVALVVISLFAITKVAHVEWLYRARTDAVADARWGVMQVALSASRHAGLFGYGPGTFEIVFPHYTQLAPRQLQGGWEYLHQDYLQTVFDWGWLGSAIWAFYVFGGLFIASWRWRCTRRSLLPRQRQLLGVVVLALAGVLLHAAVDFPLQILSIQLYVATYLGVCWSSSSWDTRSAATTAYRGGSTGSRRSNPQSEL